MSNASVESLFGQAPLSADENKRRFPSSGNDPEVLADIYEDNINIAIWERDHSEALEAAVAGFLAANPRFETTMTVSPGSVRDQVSAAAGGMAPTELCDSVTQLVKMFCCLFDLQRAGLRMAMLDRAMCPRFHVDRVPCRLVSTYRGPATEWLPHQAVNRSKLGPGSNGLADDVSGLFGNEADIRRLTCGDVALLKGELWAGNEDAGLVHRSPAVPAGENRLLLSIDFSN